MLVSYMKENIAKQNSCGVEINFLKYRNNMQIMFWWSDFTKVWAYPKMLRGRCFLGGRGDQLCFHWISVNLPGSKPSLALRENSREQRDRLRLKEVEESVYCYSMIRRVTKYHIRPTMLFTAQIACFWRLFEIIPTHLKSTEDTAAKECRLEAVSKPSVSCQ